MRHTMGKASGNPADMIEHALQSCDEVRSDCGCPPAIPRFRLLNPSSGPKGEYTLSNLLLEPETPQMRG